MAIFLLHLISEQKGFDVRVNTRIICGFCRNRIKTNKLDDGIAIIFQLDDFLCLISGVGTDGGGGNHIKLYTSQHIRLTLPFSSLFISFR